MATERKFKTLLGSLPFFADFDPVALQTIMPLFQEKKYKKNSVIFLEGDEGNDFYIIKSGVVKIYSFDGVRKVILAFFRDGDFFGEMALMKKGLFRSATAETLEPTVLYVLKRADFEKLLETNNKLTQHLLFATMDRLRKANEQIQDLTFLNVRTRIYKMLIRLSDDHGVAKQNGVMINLKLTHQQIADMVGAVRETVTKVLLELQEEGLISIDRKKILIKDMNILEKMGS
ncbi:Crp/Fnr family transcriptional regulator [Paenibacillus gansuensis]|uniref:Crp/Fnr family transcriptional regulator n=1 Tax=Paenibacillus gansuensis TaxID=306542 RepID=A0ABW5PIZ2_9BACL